MFDAELPQAEYSQLIPAYSAISPDLTIAELPKWLGYYRSLGAPVDLLQRLAEITRYYPTSFFTGMVPQYQQALNNLTAAMPSHSAGLLLPYSQRPKSNDWLASQLDTSNMIPISARDFWAAYDTTAFIASLGITNLITIDDHTLWGEQLETLFHSVSRQFPCHAVVANSSSYAQQRLAELGSNFTLITLKDTVPTIEQQLTPAQFTAYQKLEHYLEETSPDMPHLSGKVAYFTGYTLPDNLPYSLSFMLYEALPPQTVY